MQYLLTGKEFDNLVPKSELDFEKEKVKMLVKAFITSGSCRQRGNMGYCDDCPIGSLDNGLSRHSDICEDEEYSK